MEPYKRLSEILNEIANRPISLGVPPWSKEELRNAYFQNFSKVREKVDSLPGAEINTYLRTLKLLYQLLCDSIDSLTKNVGLFRSKAQKNSIHNSNKTKEFNKLEFSIQKDVFAYSAWIYAIHNHCTMTPNISSKVTPQIKQKSVEAFELNEKYLFLRALRHCITHKPPIYPPHWQINWTENGKQIKFIIDSSWLPKIKDRNDEPESHEILLSFINKNPFVDIEKLCKHSQSSVKTFYNWLVVQIKNDSRTKLDEYQKYARWLVHFDKKAFVNVARQFKIRC